MNVSSRVIGVSLVVAFLSAFRTSDGAPAASSLGGTSAHVGDAVAGKATFTQYCSICHGVGAKGFIGPHIAGVNWTTPGLHAIVRGGVGGYGSMPAFNADVVTDKNIADIAAYLAQLPASASGVALETTAASAPAVAASPAAVGAMQSVAAASGDGTHGRVVYSTVCAGCHGATGQGGFGPSLRGEKTRKDLASAIAWIKNPKPPMPKLYPDPLSDKDVNDVATYIESL